ncbi:MAG: hypothetical protein U9R25_01610 [Chloroflexota bacterium]|nr:hypothetical protein [Chloroflexota bacterium]
MRTRKYVVLVFCLMLVFVATANAGGAGDEIELGPGCSTGSSYDPACDVNRDGVIDVVDITLTASHWGHQGLWTADYWSLYGNAGTSLGSNFLGTTDDRPIVLRTNDREAMRVTVDGRVGVGTDAPGAQLHVDAQRVGKGIRVSGAGDDGVAVDFAGGDGVDVFTAREDGFQVFAAGDPSFSQDSDLENGVEVAGAGGNGLFVGRADIHGVSIESAGSNGMLIVDAANYGIDIRTAGGDGITIGETSGSGMTVGDAGESGLYIGQAAENGVVVSEAGDADTWYWSPENDGLEVGAAEGHGLFVGRADLDGIHVLDPGQWAADLNGDVRISGSCVGCKSASFARNVGDRSLDPGEIVVVRGVAPGTEVGQRLVLDVAPASEGGRAIGVVAGRASITERRLGLRGKQEIVRTLVPAEGAAQSGEFLIIVTHGPMRVQVDAGQNAIEVGDSLMVDRDDGHVRAARQAVVDGITVAEMGSIVGVALEPLWSGDGLMWVLVGAQ